MQVGDCSRFGGQTEWEQPTPKKIIPISKVLNLVQVWRWKFSKKLKITSSEDIEEKPNLERKP